MQLPLDLQKAIEEMAHSVHGLKIAREQITQEYREGKSSKKAFQDSRQLLAYLLTRMPATYATNVMVFRAIRERLPEFRCNSLVDLGAGPGTATWGALNVFPELRSIHLIEREQTAIEAGKKLSRWNAVWEQADLTSCRVPPADLAILSYVLGELKPPFDLFQRLWDAPVTLFAFIEPGTPKGFERILAARDFGLSKGATIIAPCPHHFPCPMPKNDWCHFAARVERSRLHRQLKGGTMGFEDEKYSYVVFSKPKFPLPSIQGRVVRPPKKESGYVRLNLCAKEGCLKEMTVTRRKEQYRAARDAKYGSIIL